MASSWLEVGCLELQPDGRLGPCHSVVHMLLTMGPTAREIIHMEPAGILRVPHIMSRSIKLLISGALLLLSGACAQPPHQSPIHVYYLGHAAFLFTLDNGLTVLTDYGESMAYGLDSPVFELGDARPDVVTLSHDHVDHAGGELPIGVSQLVTGGAGYETRGLTITPIPTFERSLEVADTRAICSSTAA